MDGSHCGKQLYATFYAHFMASPLAHSYFYNKKSHIFQFIFLPYHNNLAKNAKNMAIFSGQSFLCQIPVYYFRQKRLPGKQIRQASRGDSREAVCRVSQNYGPWHRSRGTCTNNNLKNTLQKRLLNLQITITTPSQIHQITKILKLKSPRFFWLNHHHHNFSESPNHHKIYTHFTISPTENCLYHQSPNTPWSPRVCHETEFTRYATVNATFISVASVKYLVKGLSTTCFTRLGWREKVLVIFYIIFSKKSASCAWKLS